MKKQIINRFLLVVAIALVAGFFATPSHLWVTTFGSNSFTEKLSEYRVTLGLDLAGGTELDYKIDLSDAIAQNNDDDPENDVSVENIAESVRDALEARVNPAGVGEIIVKRSQVDDAEHIIIQMPPSSNVEQAKADAEKDNRLEFFEEDPSKLQEKRIEIAEYLSELTPTNWDTRAQEIANNDEITSLRQNIGPFTQEEILDPALGTKIFEASPNTIIEEIIQTQTDMETSLDEEGNLEIVAMPRPILAIVYVRNFETDMQEVEVTESAEARHILFAYPGAMRAPAELPYQTSEEALAKAQETLTMLQEEGTDNFEDLAKELSTEPAAQQSGGNLGTFEPGQMAGPFNDAVFGTDSPGLISEIIETDFGYHIIEVLDRTQASTQMQEVRNVTYDMLQWEAENLSWIPTPLGGAQLENAVAGFNEVGQYLVNLLFDSEGGELFADLTENVASRQCNGGPCRLGIKVGGQWITQPTVREKIVGRTAQITGNFNAESARQLANDLNLGAIDAPVILSGQTTITPELGNDQLQKSMRAGIYGFIATILFMIFSYKFAGIIAAIALMIYAGLFVTLLKVWPESFGGPIVLTLAGIAGVILSVGLAVDGNILIFERFREELNRGRNLRQALDLGFERAWTAIRDSNLTTLLTCVILFSLGSSIIKGFAITLIVGTLLSLFSAITISRTLLRFALLFPAFQKKTLYGYSETNNTTGGKIRKRK